MSECTHVNWDDYFERCPDCGFSVETMTPEQLKEYNAQFEEE